MAVADFEIITKTIYDYYNLGIKSSLLKVKLLNTTDPTRYDAEAQYLSNITFRLQFKDRQFVSEIQSCDYENHGLQSCESQSWDLAKPDFDLHIVSEWFMSKMHQVEYGLFNNNKRD